MYKLKDIKLNELKDIAIAEQKEIIEQTGSPLILEDGYSLIQKQTQYFTLDDPMAKEADRLLFELVEKHRKQTPQKQVIQKQGKAIPLLNKEAIRIRENERLRSIRLLKIKLTLKPMSA